MRKHNVKCASRVSRDKGDRTNAPQQLSHSIGNSKTFQFAANVFMQYLVGFKRVY